ncbi:MAG TPA: oligosaccharide flippase family protein [Gemmatimonadaceae bacterium]|nr:oligosaccharide flippase family protein [Gemmatimonadaceae bacterium]
MRDERTGVTLSSPHTAGTSEVPGDDESDPLVDTPSPSRRSSRVRRIALYGASRAVTEALLAARGLVLASILGPEAFGVWKLFRIAARYAPLAALGVSRGMEREVTQGDAARGAQRPVEAMAARTTLGFSLVMFTALALLALIASFLVSDRRAALAMRAFAAAVLAEQLLIYGLVYLRARGELRRTARFEILAAAAQLVLTAGPALVWGLRGAFAGFVVACVIPMLLVARRVPHRPALSRVHLQRLLHVGTPVAATLLLGTALTTADRLIVAGVGGMRMLGYYAFAVSIAGLAGTAAWVVRTVTFPHVYGHARDAGHAEALRSYLHGTLVPFARLFPPLLGVFALLIGPAVMLVLPRYAAAIAPARIAIFTGVSAGFASLGAVGMVAADRQRVLPVISGGAVALEIVLSLLALHTGGGLSAVAAAALAAQTGYGVMIVGLVMRTAGIDHPGRTLVRACIPLVWCLAAIWGLGRVLPGNDPASVAAALGVYALLLVPLLPVMRRAVRAAREA